MHWTSVVVFGRYEELSDLPQPSGNSIAPASSSSSGPAGGCLLRASSRREHEHGATVFYRVCIDRVTGRRAASPQRVLSPQENEGEVGTVPVSDISSWRGRVDSAIQPNDRLHTSQPVLGFR